MFRLCGFHRVARILFVCLLGLGLAAIVAMLAPTGLRSVLRDVYSKRPLADSGQGGFTRQQDARSLSLLTRLKSVVQTTALSHGDNTTTQREFLTTQRGISSAASSSRHLHNRSVAAPRLSPASTRPPPPPLVASKSIFEVTVALPGKLGNHMFQYASLLGIARMNGRRPFCKTHSGLHKFFHVTHVEDRSDKGFEGVYESDYAAYDPVFERLPNKSVILLTYLQSWRYFNAIRDTIKEEFRFRQSLKDQAEGLIKKYMARTGKNVTVGIHVRRGDMVFASSRNRGYHIAPASYVIQAMNYMRKKHGNVTFIVVSDDLNWCRSNLPQASDYFIADSAPGEVHLALLASCDHVIMTVGTYGWWGGYLSGGDVVYYWDPKVCLHHPPLPVEIRHPQDYYPPSWIPLPG